MFSAHEEIVAKEGAAALASLASGPVAFSGVVQRVSGQTIAVNDRLGVLEIGARLLIEISDAPLPVEVIAIGDGEAICLPFGSLTGVRRGDLARFPRQMRGARGATISPSNAWRGRILDALGRPMDGKGPIPAGTVRRPVRAAPPAPVQRARLGAPVDFGVRALSLFTPMRRGQRVGVFAAAGVGKSALLSMIARGADCDVAVIALIGERGRELREFVEDSLGEEGLARAVVIAATADEPALMRREAAFTAMTVAEHFRDQGAHVLCLLDSLTRVAAAQREIGLAAGEPPTTKGYTPSVFTLLPSLLERLGPGLERGDGAPSGAMTGVFSVLVEGDDADEPIADAARAALDGHVVLSRAIAERGRFPAVDVLKSLSRNAVSPLTPHQENLVRRARRLTAVYEDMREMVRIGAYSRGANREVDAAIDFSQQFEQFLTQSWDGPVTSEGVYDGLEQILSAFPEDDLT